MKICLVITSLGLGGAQKQVCDLADEYIKLGHEVLLISLTGRIVIQPKKNLDIIELKLTKKPLSFIKACRLYLKTIKKFYPDVIHSHMVHANIFSRLMRLFVPVNKLISTAHSNNEGGKLRLLAYRFTDKLADLSTNVSIDALNCFIENKAMFKNKSLVINNGVNLNEFNTNNSKNIKSKLVDGLGLKKQDKLILSVGRLSLAKDYPNLLKAFHLFLEQRNDYHLIIIGDGELEIELKKLSCELKIDSHVHFLGFRNDISDWLNCVDLYVLSSKWEGFGLVIAEAMACGCLVVSTDCGGTAEVMEHKEYLVPVNNHPQLYQAIEKALSLDDEIKNQLIIKAKKKIQENFSIDRIAKQWISLYEK